MIIRKTTIKLDEVPFSVIVGIVTAPETLAKFTYEELNRLIETLDLERQHREQERKDNANSQG